MKPIIDSINEITSTLGLVSSPTFFNPKIASNKAIAKKGTNIQKIQFHDNLAKIIPVNVGPMAGANIITKAHMPIAAPNL